MHQDGTLRRFHRPVTSDEGLEKLVFGTAVDSGDRVGTTAGIEALAALRAAWRRAHRRAEDNFDRFYRVYVTALIGLFGLYLGIGLVDEATISSGTLDRIGDEGVTWLGLVAALAAFAGARSGANGGPLALDEVEVHHVLLSPLPRRLVLLEPMRRTALSLAVVSGVVGAATGELAARQLPGRQTLWVASGAASGVAISAVAIGCALAAQGGPSRRLAVITSTGLLAGWSLLDLAVGTTTSPMMVYGHLALWPMNRNWSALVALAASALVLVAGWKRIGNSPVEQALTRSRVLRQIRFAIAQQDLRSLIVLRRQLAAETPRNQPWITIPFGTSFEERFPVAVRAARSYMRWPLTRVVRVLSLSAAVGVGAAGLWHGSRALIAVVGVASYLAAIEVVEPLSEEFDRPGILELIPVAPGRVYLAYLFAATALFSGFWITAAVVAMAVSLDWQLGATMASTALPAGAASVAGAALSIKRLDSPTMVPTPEAEGPRMLIRLLWPPALATAGALPVLIAMLARSKGEPIVAPIINTASAVVIVALVVWAWIRSRDQLTALTPNEPNS